MAGKWVRLGIGSQGVLLSPHPSSLFHCQACVFSFNSFFPPLISLLCFLQEAIQRDTAGSQLVKTLLSKLGGAGLIPIREEAKMPQNTRDKTEAMW